MDDRIVNIKIKFALLLGQHFYSILKLKEKPRRITRSVTTLDKGKNNVHCSHTLSEDLGTLS